MDDDFVFAFLYFVDKAKLKPLFKKCHSLFQFLYSVIMMEDATNYFCSLIKGSTLLHNNQIKHQMHFDEK